MVIKIFIIKIIIKIDLVKIKKFIKKYDKF